MSFGLRGRKAHRITEKNFYQRNFSNGPAAGNPEQSTRNKGDTERKKINIRKTK